MKLKTPSFGHVTYEAHEVLEIRGLRSTAFEWLLLADKSHPHLYWLQSVTDVAETIPVCSIAGVTEIRIPGRQRLPDWTRETALIGLAEVYGDGETLQLEMSRPILISAHTRQGIRLLADEDQTLQHAPSDKVAPLRECA